jgi:acetyl-CoA synthetase
MTITSVSREQRVFAPPPDFVARARVPSPAARAQLYERSIADPEGFWAEQAEQLLWRRRWDTVLQWDPPHARWFDGGELDISENCLDRHVAAGLGDRVALVWEGEPGEVRRVTYAELRDEVARFARVLADLGVRAGDRVGIYMGMVPETAVAMLACARLGAVHSVVFGGFAAEAVADRMNDAGAVVVVTQDAAWRRGQEVALKATVDAALRSCPTVRATVVLRRTGAQIPWDPQRDHDWHECMARTSEGLPPAGKPAEHPLFILYTSGTTGKPKGVLHTTAGYLLGAATTARYVFDLRDDDVYWCTADVGWVTGHSYLVYGPLANGATILMYEGAPNQPTPSRLWEMIARHRVTVFYTAPTAIRTFVKWGEEHVRAHDLSSLRLLGTVGEPINPEAWMWYHDVIGGGRCPIVDTWWQTETGAIMISPLPGAMAAKPGSCALPMFGVVPRVLRDDGSAAAPNEGGYLVIERPWPSMMRTIWGDDERFRATYFARFPGRYFTGDGARCDEDGYFWVMGRVDDVVNVAGHRLGTAEIESALVSHPAVAEAAVVGRPDELRGQALVAFVTLRSGHEPSPTLAAALQEHVAGEIGRFARPDTVRFADAVPKTRSGKIMRRLLAELAAGRAPAGDVTTLEDLGVLARLRADEER